MALMCVVLLLAREVASLQPGEKVKRLEDMLTPGTSDNCGSKMAANWESADLCVLTEAALSLVEVN